MKHKLVLVGLIAVTLCACGESQEVSTDLKPVLGKSISPEMLPEYVVSAGCEVENEIVYDCRIAYNTSIEAVVFAGEVVRLQANVDELPIEFLVEINAIDDSKAPIELSFGSSAAWLQADAGPAELVVYGFNSALCGAIECYAIFSFDERRQISSVDLSPNRPYL